MKSFHLRKKNQAGFIIADFLFSFVLVISIGIIMFALTFALATVEVAQYIVWSAARTYASGNFNETISRTQATMKFTNLSAQFPLLTGQGEASPWFKLDDFKAQDHDTEATFISKVTNGSDRLNRDGNLERRQPWTGASANIYLKLFANMSVPFLGKISNNAETDFTFRIYAFVIRHPSFEECKTFFDRRFSDGIQRLDTFQSPPVGDATAIGMVEDNGC